MRRTYLLVILLLCTSTGSAQIIHTIAGGGPGSGIPATSANLNQPMRVVLDSSGNYYFSAYGLHRVFKVDSTGTLFVVAGTGLPGFSGDGGPATNAMLYYPIGIALDSSGNLYIADSSNQRIRKVDTSGKISTVAGNGGAGYNGDNILAVNATLYNPFGVFADSSGNIYIADVSNHRIRKVNTSGVITTVAGTGVAGYNGDGIAATSAMISAPEDVLVDSSGNLLIAEEDNNRVRKVNTGGIISTVAGTGAVGYNGDGIAATSASLDAPRGVAEDASGNIYIDDESNNRIRKVDLTGKISTVAGNGAAGYNGSGILATSANINYPFGVTVDGAGQIYIADRDNNRVRKVDTTGKIFDIAGNGSSTFGGDEGLATGASLYYPLGLAADASGNVYIADTYNHRIRKVDTSGNISTVAGTGSAGFNGDGILATSATLYYPYGVTLDASGNLYIADYYNQRIRKVDAATHIISTVAGGYACYGPCGDGGPATGAGLDYPAGVAVDASGNLYFVDQNNLRLRKVDTSGTISTIAGTGSLCYGSCGDGGPAKSASLYYPQGVAVDALGNIYISDSGNNRIRKVDVTTHFISTVAGVAGAYGFSGDGGPATSAVMGNTFGVTFDGAGNLYIADRDNQRIRKVDAITYKISTVAGNGGYGFSGDGGPATTAMMAYPWGVAVDGAGNIFIADSYNYRIRKVDGTIPAPAVSLSATSLDFGHSPVGTQTVAQSVTVTNRGNAALNVSSISASGDFLESDDCTCAPIAPSNYCTVNVSFLPTTTGTRTGTLTITDDAGNSPQSVSLTGTGDPATTVKIGAPSVTYPANGSVTVSVTSGADTVTGNVSLSVDGNPQPAQALTSGSTVFTISALSAGSHNLSAAYAAQGNFAASSVTGTLIVNQANASVTPNPASKTYGTGDPAFTGTLTGFLAADNVTVKLTGQPLPHL